MAEKILQLVSGFSASRVLYTFTKIGVVDVIASARTSLTAEQIATKLGAEYQPEPLFRTLRFAAGLGLIDMHEGPVDNLEYHKTFRFDLNETSELLREGSPRSLRPMVLYRGCDAIYNLWGCFGESAKTGRSVAPSALGVESFWDYLQQDEETNKYFNLAMSTFTASQLSQVTSSYDFTQISSIADIGGGLGTQLFGILKQYPHIKKGHLFEIPSVIEKVTVPEELKERVELHAGSFLEEETTIPKGVDLYLLKSIIHDWADDEAIKILKATRKVMADNSKLIVIEYVVPHGNGSLFPKALDLHMMVVLGAKERTEEEYRHLLKSSGLELTRVLGQGPNLVEARPWHL